CLLPQAIFWASSIVADSRAFGKRASIRAVEDLTSLCKPPPRSPSLIPSPQIKTPRTAPKSSREDPWLEELSALDELIRRLSAEHRPSVLSKPPDDSELRELATDWV
ncbi:hypothetical protein U1Q18_027539, partial [Sarracenia purpurea var. burkii]